MKQPLSVTARRGQEPVQEGGIQSEGSENFSACSLEQERIWLLTRIHGASPAFHERGGACLEGDIDASLIEAAASAISMRHEVLRMRFAEQGGQPVQVVAPEVNIIFHEVALTSEDAAHESEHVQAIACEEVSRPFDLATGPLWRLCSIRLNAERRFLVLTMHQLVSDGDRSIEIFFDELFTLLCKRSLKGHTDSPAQYQHYSRWQHEQAGVLLEQHLAYWRQELADAPEAVEFPTDRPRPTVRSFVGAMVERFVDG